MAARRTQPRGLAPTALLAILALLTCALPAQAQEAEAEAEQAPPSEEAIAAEEQAAEKAKSPVPEAKSLDELLELVRRGFEEERAENQRREQEFMAAKERQQELLNEAKATLAAAEALSQRLETRYNDNESAIGEGEARLAERLGQMGELFGVVRQVATDLSGQSWDSLVSSQLGTRKDLLDRLGRSKELPTTEDLEKLWGELLQEIVEQGKVVRYDATVLTLDGEKTQREVTRAGPFVAISNGRYLAWEARDQLLRELNRQPPGKYLDTVPNFEATSAGIAALAVDPARGALLTALIDTPSFTERIQQGKFVGYTIIGLGLSTVLLGLVRWLMLVVVGRKVAAQQKRDQPDPGNPLGRLLGVYEQNQNADPETLELRLDEAVVRETARLDRFIWLVKAVSAVAPLLGLLGTVTGMIQTFQAITLFGAGDPKMMAGGISEALVTTMLGLYAAVPLVLLHSTLANSARRINYVLDEQSAGLIATRAENVNVGD